MMLHGKKIKVLAVLLLVVSFLFFACCNKKSIENKNFTTKDEIKQDTITTEEQTEQATYVTIEKDTPSTKENVVITTGMNYGGDNEIAFDVAEESESLNISTTLRTTNVSATSDNTTDQPTTQQIQTVTQPATDSDGWVTKWY